MKARHKIFIILAAVLFNSCSEDLLKEETPHLLTTTSLYSSYDGLVAGINGLYAKARQEREGMPSDAAGIETGNHLRAEMWLSGTDNLVPNLWDTAPPAFSLLFSNWANFNTATNGRIENNFLWLYSIINAANTIINNAENRDDIDWGGPSVKAANKKYVLAEAKAVRAWAYRHLTYGWGDVPLNLNESDGSNIITDWVRTPVLEVRKQMIKDWIFAQENIGSEPASDGKMTKGAVQTYLAEMYLAIGKPDSALYWADACINNPAYKLTTEAFGANKENNNAFMSNFYEQNSKRSAGNKEALWTLEFEYGVAGGGKSIMRRWHLNRHDQLRVGGIAPFQITYERGGRGIARIGLSKYALDVYEKKDTRFAHEVIRKYLVFKNASQNSTGIADKLPSGYNYGDTVFYNTTTDITSRGVYNWPHSRKFESVHPATIPSETYQYDDQIYMRLAETYLLKAEAEFKLGKKQDAANTINVLRKRSNATPISANDITMNFILDERSRELLLEEHRRWTLLRTHTWLERVHQYNKNGGSTAAARDTLFPIPQSVIDANLTSPMPQNPGF